MLLVYYSIKQWNSLVMAETYLQINKLVCQSQKYKNSTKASLVPLHNTLTLYDTEQAQLGNSLITGKEFLSHMPFQILFDSEDMDSRPRPPRFELQLCNLCNSKMTLKKSLNFILL